MANVVFLEAFTTVCVYNESRELHIPFESYLTYCIYKYCSPSHVTLNVVSTEDPLKNNITSIILYEDGLQFTEKEKVPWQVSSCVYPVVMYEDTIITGLCAVARHITKYKSVPQNPREHGEGLLGFRKSCLQAPNEASIWTKFCEVDIIKTVKEVFNSSVITEIPKNLVRFENHLKKPVRVHNVYKMARDLRKDNLFNKSKEIADEFENTKITSNNEKPPDNTEKVREHVKNRKWKSETKKELAIDCSVKIEDLQIKHQYAEGPFFTLADLILLPSYHIIVKKFGSSFESLLPITHIWYSNIVKIPEVQPLMRLVKIENNLTLDNVVIPTTDDVSIYKCDPKRHNPKKRLFTKEDDIENALSSLFGGMELDISSNEFESSINWNEVPDGANPSAGHLPHVRVKRKTQQLENLTLAILSIAKAGDLIVDFCSGGGHLGILVAYLLPKCTVILLENKEQSLLRARERVHEMGLKNVYFFQCNLDFFIGKFDIGIALHACGIASDLVLDKCLKANAKFVICPCCYGSIHATDRLVYPRSNKFSSVSIQKYLCIGHAADQTHGEHPLTVRGSRCMAAIDSDRARLAEEFGYKVTLSKLKPVTCTPKNNLLIGVPS